VPRGRYVELRSPYGHDAFLMEFDAMNRILTDFLG
jgi:homoserine acetyltransferase